MKDTIVVRGAREHNLTGVDLEIPRGRLVVFTGVSGSGKSSLAMDTLWAEGQRRLLESLATASRRGAPALARPAFDMITGLPPTIGVPQGLPAAGRQTVGSATDTLDLLRVLFAHAGLVHCTTCERPLPVHTTDEVVAAILDLPQGSRLTLLAPLARGRTGGLAPLLEEVLRQGFSRVRVDGATHLVEETPPADARKPHDVDLVVDRLKVAPRHRERLAEGVQTALAAGQGRLLAEVTTPEGQQSGYSWADHPWCPEHDLAWPVPTPAHLSAGSPAGACPECAARHGPQVEPCLACADSRLGPVSRQTRLGGRSYFEAVTAPLEGLGPFFDALPGRPATAPLVDEFRRRCAVLGRLGLGHLPLARPLSEVSSGERGRLRLGGLTSGELSGVLYVVDEPSLHLGPTDLDRVVAHLRALADEGNTVVTVDHHPAMVAAADHEVCFGPGAGRRGGRILYEGPPRAPAPSAPAVGVTLSGSGALHLTGARGANLRGVDIDVPHGALTAVTGPSGSGKSALVQRTLARAIAHKLRRSGPPPLPHDTFDGAVTALVRLSRAPLGRSARSCVATAAGLWSTVRTLLSSTREARIRGFGPERFTFNRPGGRCEACQGAGVRSVRLDLVPDAVTVCEVCEGRRFDRATLAVAWRGLHAHALLNLEVDEALRLFAGHARLYRPLRTLSEVGLGYLVLGQRTDTLSGGEAQRVRLAATLGGAADGPGQPLAGTAMLLDTPESGLHADDVARVVALLVRLAGLGAAIVCETNDGQVIAASARVHRLGPGAGPDGGRLL